MNEPPCIHQLAVCPDCGGLEITEYTELTGTVSGVTIDGDRGRYTAPAGTRLFWTPGPTPCRPIPDASES
jgi:hypothetical protein